MLSVGLEKLHIYSVWAVQNLSRKKCDIAGYKQRNAYYTFQLDTLSKPVPVELEYNDITEATGCEYSVQWYKHLNMR